MKPVVFHGIRRPGRKLFRLDPHKNPGLEIVLLTKGECVWEVEGRHERVKPDTIFFTLPWEKHGSAGEMHANSELFWICIELASMPCDRPRKLFRFHRSLGFTPRQEREISAALTACPVRAIHASSDAAWLMPALCTTLATPQLFQESRALGLLKLVLIELARSATAAQPQAEAGDGESERRVRRFLTHLTAHRAETWTLERMSRHCGLGRTQFSAVLKRQTGDSPITFLNRLRVASAQELLRTTNKSVTEIGLEVGFNSSQYFATVFKQFTDTVARRSRDKS